MDQGKKGKASLKEKVESQGVQSWLNIYRQGLIKYIHRRIKDYHAAEDLCQETLFRAYRAMATLESPTRLKSWLYSIAYHVTVDWLRHESARKRTSSYLEKHRQSYESVPSIDSILIAREKKEHTKQKVDQLWRIVGLLPPIYREVFELRYRQWRPICEIAQKIGIPEGNVKVRLFRSRRMLLKALEEMGLAERLFQE